jgi:hypothetical protein
VNVSEKKEPRWDLESHEAHTTRITARLRSLWTILVHRAPSGKEAIWVAAASETARAGIIPGRDTSTQDPPALDLLAPHPSPGSWGPAWILGGFLFSI